MSELSPNAQAILLLTAPLITGRGKPSADPLTAAEYRLLARRLRELQRQPADLLTRDSKAILKDCRFGRDPDRIERLLDRGFLLSQAVERWRTRAIWVVSRADGAYPRRLKKRLGEEAPPILYGCGDPTILDAGGLAVVGSRKVDDTLIEYTEGIGRLTAAAQRALYSGGARGIDQAAMRGALGAGGRVAGVLGDSLEKAVVRRDYRNALVSEQLALVCPYDPAARFQVGHAMKRNKLIYALADAALVVSSDYGKGGTWSGAVEQLDKLKLVPVYVRTNEGLDEGLDGLRERGAIPWPNPRTPEALEEGLSARPVSEYGARNPGTLALSVRDGLATEPATTAKSLPVAGSTMADDLYTKVRELVEAMDSPRTEARVAGYLQVSRTQARVWLTRYIEEELKVLFGHTDTFKTESEVAEELQVSKHQVRGHLRRLVEEGAIEKLSRPDRYRSTSSIGPLFDVKD